MNFAGATTHMRKSKSIRTWIATFVALCLLFAQLATAAYACPQLLKHSVDLSDSEIVAMGNCESMSVSEMDKEQPGLCKAHCESGRQSHEFKSNIDVQLTPMDIWWSLALVLRSVPQSVGLTSAGTHTPERPPGSPPLYLVHQVFRL